MPIDRTAKTALDGNLNNGITSDAPKVKANNDTVYNFVDGLEAAQTAHAGAAVLPHADQSVTTAKLRDLAVTTSKIAPLSVTTDKIANESLDSTKFVPGALTNETQNGLNILALQNDTAKLKFINAPSKDRFRNYSFVSSQRNPYYIVGDSISEGSNATDYTKDNWASIVRKAIQRESDNTNYGFANFNTYVVDSSNTTITTFHKITRSGFAVHADPFEPAVFGGTRITSVTAGEYVDVVYTGKDAIVVYTADATYGALVEVSVDGSVVGTIDTKVTNGKANGSFSAPITVASEGAHTIRLKNLGGAAQLCGMIYLDDANVNTPVLYNVGRSSIAASDIANDMLDLYSGGGMTILALGVNDQLLSKDIATFKTKIERVYENITSNSGALIVCDFMFSLPPTNEYKVALADIAKKYPNFVFLDFAQLWFQNETINKFSEMLDSDGVHPTAKGHEHIANTILKYMGFPYTKATLDKLDEVDALQAYANANGDTASIAATLQNGWVNFNETTHETARYYKTKDGAVHLKGFIKNGTTTPYTTIFTLPEGYRPALDVYRPTISSAGAAVEVGSITITRGGEVQIVSGSNAWFNIGGIYFDNR